jgi:uncharacterized membrane protein
MYLHQKRNSAMHRAFSQDRKGSITVLTSAAMVTMLCLGGLVIDLGDIFEAHRALQGTSDLAVIAAASNLPIATVAADSVAGDNGYAASAVNSVITGVYTNNPAIPINLRFTPAPAAASNAAKVIMSSPQKLFYNGAFNMAMGGKSGALPNSEIVGAQSIAVNTVSASFTVGSGLATLNGGLINSVLGGLLGGNLSLSVMDYQSLLSTQIDLFQFSNALATELNLTGVTYNQVLSGTISLGAFVQALQTAGANSAAAGAINQIVTAIGNSTETINLSQLVNFGPFKYYQVGAPEVMPVTVSVYQLLTLAGQLAGGGHQISLALGVAIPGISTVSGTLTVGEPPVSSSMITVGATSTSVHTAQTRLQLNVNLLSLLGTAAVRLPLYIELASATATMSQLSCNVMDAPGSSVTLAVTPAVANTWIGSVTPASAMTDFTTEPTVSPANLVNLQVLGLGLVSVNGAANVPVSNVQPTNLTYSYTDIQNDTMKTTSTTDFFASAFSGLVSSLSLNATLLGVPVAVPPGTLAALQPMLTAVATPTDQLVTEVLQTMGVSLGVANAWVTGVHCAPAMLAQ